MMDQTQPLVCEEEEEEEERPRRAARDEEPRGRLLVVLGKCDSDKEFPVYRGDNVIGRHESCGVRLEAQSVSKRHAVIEVDDDGHLIYDCNSLNKTRRLRRVLKPGVRYTLHDGDMLLFADVACRYFLTPRWSEGPGGQAQTRAEGEEEEEGAKAEAEAEAGDSGEDSLALPPTQNYQLTHDRTPYPLRASQAGFSVQDSQEEGTLARSKAHPGTSGLNTTPGFGSQSRSKFQTPSNTVVPESDVEDPGDSLACSPIEGVHSGSEQSPAVPPTLPRPHQSSFLPSLSDSEEESSSVTGEGAVSLSGHGEPAQGGSSLEILSAHALLPHFNLDSDEEEEEEAGTGAGMSSGPQAVVSSLSGLSEPLENNNNNSSSSSGSSGNVRPACLSEGSDTDVEGDSKWELGGTSEDELLKGDSDTDIDEEISESYTLQLTQSYITPTPTTATQKPAEQTLTRGVDQSTQSGSPEVRFPGRETDRDDRTEEGASTPEEDTPSLLSEPGTAVASYTEEPTQDYITAGPGGASTGDTQPFVAPASRPSQPDACFLPPPRWRPPEPADRPAPEPEPDDTEPLGSPASSAADTEPVDPPGGAQGAGGELDALSTDNTRSETTPTPESSERAPLAGSFTPPESMETQSAHAKANPQGEAEASSPALVEQVNELERTLAYTLDLGPRETQKMDTSDQIGEMELLQAGGEWGRQPSVAVPSRGGMETVREEARERTEGRIAAFPAQALKLVMVVDAETEQPKPSTSQPQANFPPQTSEQPIAPQVSAHGEGQPPPSVSLPAGGEETPGDRPAEGTQRTPRTQGAAVRSASPSGGHTDSAPPHRTLKAAQDSSQAPLKRESQGVSEPEETASPGKDQEVASLEGKPQPSGLGERGVGQPGLSGNTTPSPGRAFRVHFANDQEGESIRDKGQRSEEPGMNRSRSRASESDPPITSTPRGGRRPKGRKGKSPGRDKARVCRDGPLPLPRSQPGSESPPGGGEEEGKDGLSALEERAEGVKREGGAEAAAECHVGNEAAERAVNPTSHQRAKPPPERARRGRRRRGLEGESTEGAVATAEEEQKANERVAPRRVKAERCESVGASRPGSSQGKVGRPRRRAVALAAGIEPGREAPRPATAEALTPAAAGNREGEPSKMATRSSGRGASGEALGEPSTGAKLSREDGNLEETTSQSQAKPASATRKRRAPLPAPGERTPSPQHKVLRRTNRAPALGPSLGATSPRILFTVVTESAWEPLLARLGGTLAQSVYDNTHLVTDRIRRTVKLLCAVARGIPVVSPDWLEQSRKSSCFLCTNSFLLRDEEQEQTFSFCLTESLHRARQRRLLQDYRIHVTPGVKPDPLQMKDIIQCSGASFLPKMPRAYKDQTVVVSCPEDLPKCRLAMEAGIPVVGAEFLLTGILQQTVELARFRLDSGEGQDTAAGEGGVQSNQSTQTQHSRRKRKR